MQTYQKATRALALGLGLLALAGMKAWALGAADATITVTPVANVSLTIAPTTYAFGTQNIGAQVVTASTLTLTNNGQVNVSVNKQVLTDPAGWTAATSAGTDQYVLYVATQSAAVTPVANDFPSSSKLGAQGNSTSLLGMGGGTPILQTSGAAASTALWFRLDMPTATSSTAGKTITVEFTGVAQ